MAIFKLTKKVSGSTITIDVNKFKTKLREKCEVQNRQALRVWLKEALEHIPGYTGTARGTLVPVGKIVRRAVTKFRPGDPLGNAKRAAKKKFIHYKGVTYRAGFEYGKDYAQALLNTNVEGLSIRNTFIFTENLPYVIFNESNSAPPGFTMPSNPPWWWSEKAAKKWKEYILTEALRKINVPKEFLKITKMKVR